MEGNILEYTKKCLLLEGKGQICQTPQQNTSACYSQNETRINFVIRPPKAIGELISYLGGK